MGHLLNTINPEAAQAIQPQPAVTVRARVGDMVRYYPRPGEGGGGRSEFSALVTVSHEDGRIDGIVFLDANDFRDLKGIPPKSPQHDWPAWEPRDRHPASPGPVPAEADRIDQLQMRISDLENKLKGIATPNYSVRLDPVREQVATQEIENMEAIASLTGARAPTSDAEQSEYSADADPAPKHKGGWPKGKPRKAAED